MSDICSKARAQLPAWTLVMLPGCPDAARRTKWKHSSPRTSARKMRSGFIRRHASSSDLAVTLAVLAVVEVDDVRVVRQVQLGRVLDRDEALVPRDFFDEAFHEGRLARAG